MLIFSTHITVDERCKISAFVGCLFPVETASVLDALVPVVDVTDSNSQFLVHVLPFFRAPP